MNGVRDGEAAGLPRARPGGAVVAHPQSRRGRSRDGRAADVFFSDPAARDFVAGVAQSCEGLGQGLLLVAVGPSRSLEDGTAAVLAAGVDGFVVYSVRDDDPYLQVVLQRRLPVVVVDQPEGTSGVSRVGIDDRAAMRETRRLRAGSGASRDRAADHAAGPGPPAGPGGCRAAAVPAFDVQRERIIGVWEAMTAAGVDPDSLTVVESYEHLPTSGGRPPRWRWKPIRGSPR